MLRIALPAQKFFEIFASRYRLTPGLGALLCVIMSQGSFVPPNISSICCGLEFLFYLLRARLSLSPTFFSFNFTVDPLKCAAIEIVVDRHRCAVKVKMAIARGISCLFIRIQGCPWAEGGR